VEDAIFDGFFSLVYGDWVVGEELTDGTESSQFAVNYLSGGCWGWGRGWKGERAHKTGSVSTHGCGILGLLAVCACLYVYAERGGGVSE